MDYLQYQSFLLHFQTHHHIFGFKPYYKWITFNTDKGLNKKAFIGHSFKPYYKWITFNTWIINGPVKRDDMSVLNLIINGLPSILEIKLNLAQEKLKEF